MAHGSFGHLVVVVDRATTSATVTGTVAATIAGPTLVATGTHTAPNATGTVAATIAGPTLAATGTVRVTGTVAATIAGPTLVASGSATNDILFDDFPGTSIDTTKWTVYNRPGDQANSEVNAVIPANVRVSSGNLLIDSKFEDVVSADTLPGTPDARTPATYHYTSGQIAMAGAPFLYGDIRVRAKLPGGTGLWPCIWMLGYQWQGSQPFTANTPEHNWPNGGWWELDIAEFMSGHRTQVNNALHFITANRTGSGEKNLPFDATTRFMVYRLVWTSTSLTWYVDAEDGNGWVTLTTMTGVAGVDIPNTPAYLIIHTAIGGFAGGTPNPATFPQTMTVDYAQVQRTASTVEVVAGTVARTIAAPTLAASGTATPPTVTGTIARTIAGPTLVATGTATLPTITGTVAATIAGPTLAATGSSVTGTVAATLAAPTLTATGTHTPYVGTVSATIAGPTLAASGTHTAPSVTGTVASTISAPTLAATGTANPPGTAGNIAVTLAPPTLAATGTVGSPATVTGTVSATLAAPTLVATGTHTNSSVTGTIAATLSAPTLAASGTVTAVATTGTVAATIGAPTLTATGFVRVTGSVAATITVTLAAFGSVGSTYDPNPEHVVITQRSRVTIEQRSRYMIGV